MSDRISVILMSFLLAVCSFGVGVLPLCFVFSSKYSYFESPFRIPNATSGTRLAKLSSLGTGLLIGTALGVIIPE